MAYVYYRYGNLLGGKYTVTRRKWNKANYAAAGDKHVSDYFSINRINRRLETSQEYLKEKIRTLFAADYNRSMGPRGESDFFEFLNNSVEDKLSRVAITSMDIKHRGIDKTYSQSELLKDANDLSDVVKKASEIIKRLSNIGDLDKCLTAYFLVNGMADPTIGNANSRHQARQSIRKSLLVNGKTYHITDTMRAHAEEVNHAIAAYAILFQYNKNYGNIKIGNLSNAEIEIVNSFTNFLNKAIGLVAEEVVTENINWIEEMVHNYSGQAYLEAKNVGNNSNKKNKKQFSKNTEDIALSWKVPPKGDGANITASLKIPGISLKRTNVGNEAKDNRTIHLKSSSLGKVLDEIEFEDGAMQEFYNAYNSYKRKPLLLDGKNRGNEELSSYAAQKQMFDYMHAAMLPKALAGSLTKDDFAYFIIINDRVTNIFEIIDLAKQDSNGKSRVHFTSGLNSSSNISNKRASIQKINDQYFEKKSRSVLLDKEKSKQRSDEIIRAINALSINFNMIISAGTTI